MTICIAGKNKIAVEAAKWLLLNRPQHKVIAIKNITDNGINNWQPSYEFFCKRNNIPLLLLEDVYEIEDLLLLSLEFDRIINIKKFRSKRLFNIHFSKLPAYKGMYTSVIPLLYGERKSGVTLHYINKGIDTGNIVNQITFPLSSSTTAKELYNLYLENAYQLFVENIDVLLEEHVKSTPQDSIGSSYFSKKVLNFSSLIIDLNKTAYEIHNQVRAYTFRDYQLPIINGMPIYKSEIVPVTAYGKAGTIVESNNFSLILNTIDYQIRLYIDKQEELFSAAEHGDIARYNEIVKAAYPVEAKNKLGWDVLIIAAYNNQFEFVNFLLENGFNPNSTNYKGTTALMYAMTAASKSSDLRTLQILAERADWTLCDDRGKDIFHYAIEYGNPIVMDFIKQSKQ